MKTTQRALYKDNTEQVQEGLKVIIWVNAWTNCEQPIVIVWFLLPFQVVEAITEAPLNKFFSTLTTLLPYVVFTVSVLAALIDLIVSKAELAEFNVSCFTLDLVEVIFLTLNFLLHKTTWYKSKTAEEKESFDKKQQVIDNVLAEVLLYPTIICSLVSVATSKPFLPDTFLAINYNGHMVSWPVSMYASCVTSSSLYYCCFGLKGEVLIACGGSCLFPCPEFLQKMRNS